jgi:hypothetical protein
MLEERRVTYVESGYTEDQLITLKEAADMLDMSMPGVIQMIFRDQLTEVVNRLNPKHHGRRMVPRAQVEALMKAK